MRSQGRMEFPVIHTWDAADALGCDSHSNALSGSSYAAESGPVDVCSLLFAHVFCLYRFTHCSLTVCVGVVFKAGWKLLAVSSRPCLCN